MLSRLPNKLKYTVWFFTLFGLLGLYAIIYINFEQNPSLELSESGTPAPPSLPTKHGVTTTQALGLEGDVWQKWSKTSFSDVKDWHAFYARVIFEVDTAQGKKQYMAYRKTRTKLTAVNFRLWHLPTIKLESEDDIVTRLHTALADIDPSSVLNQYFQDAVREQDHIFFRNIQLHTGENHTLFKVILTQNQWDHFQHSLAEIKHKFEFSLVTAEHLDMRRSIRKRWTAKTRKVLEALRVSA